MSLQVKIDKLSQKFKQIKNTESSSAKKAMINQLRKLADEALKLMQEHQQPSNTKWRRQIDDVLKKCSALEDELAFLQPNIVKNSIRIQNYASKESELTKMAVRSVIMHEIRSSQLRVKPEQYQQIYKRMCNNLQVMKQMEEMVKEQGNDLSKVQEYIDATYENAVKANQQLKEANQFQKQSRRLKFKMVVTGFFAGLGYKIMGLPGLITGLFFGHKATS